MGCDIHIIAEVRQRNGRWIKNTIKLFPDPYYKEGSESGYSKDKLMAEPNSSRFYDWFAILADVRNGTGFAGFETGAGFRVIAEPRGVPDDACPEWKETVDQWGIDLHSHSWLTLADFDAFDWNQVTVKTGVIHINEYEKLRGTNEAPSGWSGSIMGGNIVTITQQKADQHLKQPIPALAGMNVYVQYEWPVIYSEWFELNIERIVNPLRELQRLNYITNTSFIRRLFDKFLVFMRIRKSLPNDGVRIVFAFDN